MNIGTSIRILPTVKPKLYAGKVGTVATKNEDEIGVLINGRIVWFLEREIEICQNGLSSSVDANRGAPSVKTRDGRSPLSQSTQRGAPTARCTGQGGAGNDESDQLPQALPDAAASCRQTLPATREEPRMPHGYPVTNPGAGVRGQEAAMGPEEDCGPSRICEGATEGSRGPGGGIIARCEGCGGLWERPKQRGRPARRCEGCR